MFNIITCREDFTINNLSECVSMVKDLLSKSDNVVIDAAGVKKIDTAAIQVLVATKKECLRNGREFILKQSSDVTNIMRSMGIKL